MEYSTIGNVISRKCQDDFQVMIGGEWYFSDNLEVHDLKPKE